MSSRAHGAPPDSPRGSRVFGPGSRRSFALALTALAVLGAGLVLFLARSGSAPSPFAPSAAGASAKYGGLPSWLPKPVHTVGRVVHASATHPWLAIEGDTVAVALRRGSVMATAVGPAVPETGRFPVPRTTPCRFTVTLTAARGDVPISVAAFTIRDELGVIHHPRVTAGGGVPLPRRLARGRSLTITVRDVLPTGAGMLSWAPGGGTPIVSWDFDVEID